MKNVRLDKFLADAGCGTRSEVKNLIRKGQVTINGFPAKKPEQKIIPDTDEVMLAGQRIESTPEFVYYLLNKPAGYVSATEDKRERTVMELIPSDRTGLFPVGRLDKDTEGLLLITNDGALAHALLSPGRHVEKTYFVRVEGSLSEEKRRLLEAGVNIGEEKLTLPARAEILNRSDAFTEFHLTIHEGKFHQVKRMCAAIGCPVTYLKRISMGPLTLGSDQKKGACRALTLQEIRKLGEQKTKPSVRNSVHPA